MVSCNEENENITEELPKTSNCTNDMKYIGSKVYYAKFVKDHIVYEATIYVHQYYDTDNNTYFEIESRSIAIIGREEVQDLHLYNTDDKDNPYPGYITVVNSKTNQCYIKETLDDFTAKLLDVDSEQHINSERRF